MMPAVFLDTSGAIALLHTADPYHAKASELASTFVKQSRRRITTAAVLTEFGDGFARKGRWKIAAEFLSALMADPLVRVIRLDDGLISRALDLRNSRSDKDWGLTDCVSFLVMTDEGIEEALTADRHFQQAGFHALLLE